MKNLQNTLKILACGAIAMAFLSCVNGNTDELLRSYDDPSDDTPRAELYTKELSVNIAWDPDSCADKFILMSAEDDGTMNFTEVYSGKANSYEDVFSADCDNKRFLYRLDKIRGKMRFNGTDCACAVASETLKDMYEPNDTADKAVELERVIKATMPCCLFDIGGRSFRDEDWYYVSLKPRSTVKILFEQSGQKIDLAETDFMFTQQGESAVVLKHNEKFCIRNDSFTAKNIYFKIMPNIQRIFAGNPGATVLEYTISVKEEIYE